MFASRQRRNKPQKNIEHPTSNIKQGTMSRWELDVSTIVVAIMPWSAKATRSRRFPEMMAPMSILFGPPAVLRKGLFFEPLIDLGSGVSRFPTIVADIFQ